MNTTHMCGYQMSVEKQAVLLSSIETVSLGRCTPNHETLLRLSFMTSVRLCLFVLKYPTSETANTEEHFHYIAVVWSVAWGGMTVDSITAMCPSL